MIDYLIRPSSGQRKEKMDKMFRIFRSPFLCVWKTSSYVNFNILLKSCTYVQADRNFVGNVTMKMLQTNFNPDFGQKKCWRIGLKKV